MIDSLDMVWCVNVKVEIHSLINSPKQEAWELKNVQITIDRRKVRLLMLIIIHY